MTREQVLDAIKAGRESKCLDGRDYVRLSDFFDAKHYPVFGVVLKEGAVATAPKGWTRENILCQLARDVDFGFKKALDCRGISSSIMYNVVKMWMWVLEDDLQHHDEYAMYGLPLFKAVAVKYGLPNLIGDDSGSEHTYEEQ